MALQAQLLRDRGILLLEPGGPLTAADFAAAAALADPWIEQQGKLGGLLIHAKAFPGWENFAALVAHLRFAREHHARVKRIAIASDGALGAVGAALARHFVAAEIRSFDHSQRVAALAWLMSEWLERLPPGLVASARAEVVAKPTHPLAKQVWLETLPLNTPPATIPPVAKAQRRKLSIVICSVNDARYSAAARSYAGPLADWPHEFVRIADARGLAEGYQRGLAQATGETVVFSHDDVEVLVPDLGHRLARALAVADVVGVAGATRISGPAWLHSGHPHLHGCVIYPEVFGGYRVSVYSRDVPVTPGIRLLDGVFLAMPRRVAESVGWDAVTCPAFHGYDVDFSMRAVQQGFRLAAASNLGIVHYSLGGYDANWNAAAERLVSRYPELGGPRSSATYFHGRTVADAAGALALVDGWCVPT